MNGVIYFTEIPEKYRNKNMEHMIGEKVLEQGLLQAKNLPMSREHWENMESRFLHWNRESIITSHIPESMWHVSLPDRKSGSISRCIVR